jgi:hypothetical protein
VVPKKTETPVSRLLLELTNTKLIYWLSPLFLGLILLFLYYAIFERLIFLNLKPLTAIEILYQRYYRAGRPLAGKYTRAETAHEFTDKLIHKIEDIYIQSKSKNFPRRIRISANQFTNIYQVSLFSNHVVDKRDTRIAFKLWRRLRHFLIVSRFRNFLQVSTNSIKNKVKRQSFKTTQRVNSPLS